MAFALIVVSFAAGSVSSASAHNIKDPKTAYKHAQDVLRFFKHHKKLAKTPAARVVIRNHRWLLHRADRELHPQPPTYSREYWIQRQIAVATAIGSASRGDPWPNCPDPFDGTGSWYDTAACENGGNWYDSPGYYRCGLQFDPGWERKYGKLCP